MSNRTSNHPADPTAQPHRLRRLGQVFLDSEKAQVRVVRAMRLRPDEVVLEIGGGDGRLSAHIAPLVSRLLVVELDPRFVDLLRRRFGDEDKVDIIEGDILAGSTFAEVKELEPRRPLIACGALPYYITSPILRWLVGRANDFTRAHLLVQREVALRAAAAPGGRDYGFLSVILQRRAEVDLGPVVRRGAFRPVPKVDSQLLSLTPHPVDSPADEACFERLVSALFGQRRKKIRNGLRAFAGHDPPPRLREECDKLGFSLDDRPEDLSPDRLYALYTAAKRFGLVDKSPGGEPAERS